MLAELHCPICAGAEISLYSNERRHAFFLVVHDTVVFASGHDKNNPTHVCFFSEHDWRRWTRKYGATLEIIGAYVIALQRES